MMNNLLSLRNEKTIVEIDSLYLTSKLQLNIIINFVVVSTLPKKYSIDSQESEMTFR